MKRTATSAPSAPPRGRRRSTCSGPANCSAQKCDLVDLWVSTKCGESDTTSGLALESHRRRRLRQARRRRLHAAVRRDDRAHRRREPGGRPLRHARNPPEVPVLLRPLRQGRRRPQGRRPLRLAAHQGQHRGRSDHHRREGPGQHPEDRQEVQGDRGVGQGRGPQRAGPVVHGFLIGRRGDGHAVRRGRLRRTLLPHRAREHHRQSHPAGDQALGQPPHGADDERAHRRGRHGPVAPRDRTWTRPARSCWSA